MWHTQPKNLWFFALAFPKMLARLWSQGCWVAIAKAAGARSWLQREEVEKAGEERGLPQVTVFKLCSPTGLLDLQILLEVQLCLLLSVWWSSSGRPAICLELSKHMLPWEHQPFPPLRREIHTVKGLWGHWPSPEFPKRWDLKPQLEIL